MEERNETLDSALVTSTPQIKRRALLPWWIKTFCWLFMIMGALVPAGFVMSILHLPFSIALYGLSSVSTLDSTGLLLSSIYLLKGAAAYGLWTEKDWAITVGKIDAIVGIVVCVFFMIVYPFISNEEGFSINFKFEILLLVPYLLKLGQIKTKWDEGRTA